MFKTALRAPLRGAWKVSTKDRPHGPAAEVAAYRLARLLGMSNVPPAVSRPFAPAMQRARVVTKPSAPWESIEAKLRPARSGLVAAAMIYWVERLQDLPPEGVADGPMAAQRSAMEVFDYLIGNWDRHSGGNVKGDARLSVLYVRDNDAAFPARLSAERETRLRRRVTGLERFSRSQVARLRALTMAALRAELERDELTSPLASAERLAGVSDRQRVLLQHMAALSAERGEASVLAFP